MEKLVLKSNQKIIIEKEFEEKKHQNMLQIISSRNKNCNTNI